MAKLHFLVPKFKWDIFAYFQSPRTVEWKSLELFFVETFLERFPNVNVIGYKWGISRWKRSAKPLRHPIPRWTPFIQFFQGSCLDNFVSNVALFAHIRTHILIPQILNSHVHLHIFLLIYGFFVTFYYAKFFSLSIVDWIWHFSLKFQFLVRKLSISWCNHVL